MNRFLVLLSLFAFSILLGGCVSLAADVTPPPGFQPTQAAQPVAVETVYPLVLPDPVNGEAIYADKCAACHGETGMSDGPMAEQLPQPAPELGNPEVARAARPVDWFMIVTQGNLENLMPNFDGSLSERERWDVVSYLYMLSMTEDTIQAGKEVYTQNCQACHGLDGQGDGPDAAGLPVPDWKADPARLARLSGAEMEEIVAAGRSSGMPAFADSLSEEQRKAVTAYVRLQSFSRATEGELAQAGSTPEPETRSTEPASEPVTSAETGPMVISGWVTNASGGSLPEDLQVELVGYDGMEEVSRQSAPVGVDGSFRFEEVEAAAERVYLASVDFQGVTYNSDVVHPDQLQPGVAVDDLVINLYETTTDASALVADRMHVFFEQMPSGTVQVVELFILNNRGNAVIAPAGPDQPVLTVDLPAGATNLQFQDGELGDKYIATENGYGDLHSFLPGTGAQLMFAYEIPFESRTDLSLQVPLHVDSAVVMMPVSGLSLESDQLTAAGERPVEGMRLNLYTSGPLEQGDRIDLTLSTGSAAAAMIPSGNGLLIGGLGLGLVLVIAGLWFYRKRSTASEEESPVEVDAMEQSADSVMDAIIALDDQFRAGELPEDAYRQRREELKARLRAMQGGD